jgi:alpha-tubulin suppressor-like RCC1 family protein
MKVSRKTTLRIFVRVFVALVTLFSATAKEAAAQSLTVTPANPTIAVGQTQQFVASEVSPATDVAAGDYHNCFLLQSGEARCVGNNSEGQLGNGTRADSSTPVPVFQMVQAAGITTGGFHTCAVLRNGTVQCWGMNEVGQLGDGTTAGSDVPVNVSGITTAIAVAAGYKHACALLANSTVKCWGDNSYGELGDGNAVLSPNRGGASTSHSSIPVTVVGITTAVAVTASDGYHSCALLQSGSVKCWGDNISGQLGNGTRTTAKTPVTVTGITTAVGVSSGDFHTCAVLGDRSISCWGLNYSGQLGDGTGWDSDIPVRVSGISTAAAVSVGVIHTCAVLQNGTARCWGYNSNGQIGDGTTTDRFIPAAVTGITTAVGAVAAGNNDSCVLLQGGSVKCWGMNTYGELGTGTVADTRTPLTVVKITPTWTTSNSAVATMDSSGLATGRATGAATITATFDGRTGSTTLTVGSGGSPTLTVTRTASGNGNGLVSSSPAGINCGYTCSATYAPGTVVTLTATPLEGSTFTGWSGCDAVSGTTCTVTMNGARSITAGFFKPVLSVSKAGTGRGDVTSNPAGLVCGSADDNCTASFSTGTQLTLTASPVTGSLFGSWSGCDSASSATCTLTLNASRSVVPTFTLSSFTLTVTKSGMGRGTVTSSPSGINCGPKCSASYDGDTVVTLTADPNNGSVFNGWSGCNTVSGSSCTVNMTATKSVAADFVGIPFP